MHQNQGNYQINITKPDGDNETISTEGFILLHLEEGQIKFSGNIDLRALAPILTKLALERLSR